MSIFFSTDTTYIRRARFLATLWTLLIFILCFLPGRDIPEIKIPLIDKWAHMVLFGVFAYLWHTTVPAKSISYKIILFLITLFTGWLVEYVQGHFVEDRTQDNMDTLSDIIGGAIGIVLYSIAYYKYNNRHKADS
jgi:VanZ family protein